MSTQFYKKVFPGTKIKAGKNTEVQIKTTKGGGRRSVSTGASITGFGADIIICDDLMKPEDVLSEKITAKRHAYFKNTLLTRIENKKNGILFVVQQRLGNNDTMALVQEIGGWEHLKLKAIATTDEHIPIGHNEYHHRKAGEALDPGREGLDTLADLRKTIGDDAFLTQWQQEPSSGQGKVFYLEKFCRYVDLPPIHHFEYFVQSWDTAVTISDTSDYSVCTTWAKKGDDYYLVDVFRKKLEYVDLEVEFGKLCEKYTPKLVIIEQSNIGGALYSKYINSKYAVQKGGFTYFRGSNPKMEKVARAAIAAVTVSQGHVFLPLEADWLEVFEQEVENFPGTKHDDQVDSMVQFLHAMSKKIGGVNV